MSISLGFPSGLTEQPSTRMQSTSPRRLASSALIIFSFVDKVKKNDSGEYVIKDGTTFIADNAFSSCNNMKSIVIPDSVKVIDVQAFNKCTSLESIVIGSGVESINTSCFGVCASIENVYYRGSADAWANIEIDTGNGALTTADIHYNYAE